MSYKFTVIINKEKRWFVGHCVELGVVSQGKTIKETQKNLKEAVALYLEDNPNARAYLSKSPSLITTFELQYS